MAIWYTNDHEWLSVEGDIATIGITDHAQQALGEIVFVELPEIGEQCIQGEGAAVVESVKSASDIYCPVNAEVVEVNPNLEDSPEIVNDSPEEDGWFFKVKLDEALDTSELLSHEDYLHMLKDES